ncbi:MAG: LD-carboxypeptidase [Bacteroidetes bacterium]|nr:LD-carboxypeptidase [Bacteroidota bacterium]
MMEPKYLKQGDKVAIVSTARKISKKEIAQAVKVFKEWGLIVVLGENIFKSCNQFAGTDQERLSDLQQMLDDKSIKAIICSRGGYGTVRIIDKLNFDKFIENPKWIVGYSDITVLHSKINKLNIESIHATMPINFSESSEDNESVVSLKKALFGEQIKYEFKAHKFNKVGTVNAPIVGGNLSILYSLRGTSVDIDTDNKILFIEDLDEYLYHIDRMMQNLKLGNKLKNLKGLIVGGMCDMNDNTIPFGKTAYEIINDVVAEYDYPVCYNFSAGHIKQNFALIMGREINLKIDNLQTTVEFDR